MSDQRITDTPVDQQIEIREVVRQTIQEFVQAEQSKAEPAYKAELQDERKRRESLEGRMNQLVEENRKARAMADEADRNSQIRSELQRLGVAKVELAFRAVKDDIVRTEDGRLQARGPRAKPCKTISLVSYRRIQNSCPREFPEVAGHSLQQEMYSKAFLAELNWRRSSRV
jgi:hypothetical protein